MVFKLEQLILTAMKAATLLIALVSLVQALAQPSSDLALSELSWNEFYRLQWDDFQGEADKNSLADAGTVVAIRAKPFLVNRRVHYDVLAIFNRSKSWARDTSPSLLAHEQLHFDIAEWYARKIRKKVAELRALDVNDVAVFNEAIQQLLLESNRIDQQYDLETLHGALPKKQAAWSAKVKSELASLKSYRKTKRIIGG